MEDRPLLTSLLKRERSTRDATITRIKGLLAERRQAYEQADIKISTTGKTVEEAAAELIEKLRGYND